MKKIIAGILFLMSFNLLAMKVTVDDAFCGEMDPFVVGDVCLVFVTVSPESRIALVFDFDKFQNKFEDAAESLVGKNIYIDFYQVEIITDGKVISVLKDFNDSYYYMKAPVEAINAN